MFSAHHLPATPPPGKASKESPGRVLQKLNLTHSITEKQLSPWTQLQRRKAGPWSEKLWNAHHHPPLPSPHQAKDPRKNWAKCRKWYIIQIPSRTSYGDSSRNLLKDSKEIANAIPDPLIGIWMTGSLWWKLVQSPVYQAYRGHKGRVQVSALSANAGNADKSSLLLQPQILFWIYIQLKTTHQKGWHEIKCAK